MKPTKPRQFRTPYQFFLARAGYSYNPATETKAEGRRKCARALAKAEARGMAAGFIDVWSVDPDPDRSYMDDDASAGYTRRDRECAEFVQCAILDANGACVASLHGIHEDIRDPLGARWSRRVVRAELFAEALDRMDEAERARKVAALKERNATNPALDALKRACSKGVPIEEIRPHTCEKVERATCGICGRSWCDRCDPTPSALCHYCHGVGKSSAPLN